MTRPFALLLGLFVATQALAARPNVVLISIDTLRADHLPMYGYREATAPFLASMAEQGVVFENAWVHIPSTTPSHASMLTGQFPSGHGSVALTVPMNREVETIAEALQKNGYHAIGAVAVSHIGRVSNFDQGFAEFTDTGGTANRDAKSVNADLFRMISTHRASKSNKPLFLFAHYFDCHAPYGWWRGETADPATSPLAERIARYDESIRHVDARIKELHRHLGENGLLENTIFIITADHGEQIGDRGLPYGHADIYVETVHVPLIAFGPGLPATRVAERVTNLDITPSIAAAAGVRLSKKVPGHDILPPRGDLVESLFYRLRGVPRSSTAQDFLVLGNPWYTRSIGLVSGSHYFVKNLDHLYSKVLREGRGESSAADRGRFKEALPLGVAESQSRYAIPATSYAPFTVTLDVVPAGTGCGEAALNVSMPPGVQYFGTTIDRTPVTRLQFSAARLDSLRITVDAACKARFYYRLDRPADAPRVQGLSASTRLFIRLYAERKNGSSDELYDLEKDPGMTRNLIGDPSLSEVRKQLERKARDLYQQIYGAAFDHRRNTPSLPREEIEKLKSLGYLF